MCPRREDFSEKEILTKAGELFTEYVNEENLLAKFLMNEISHVLFIERLKTLCKHAEENALDALQRELDEAMANDYEKENR